MSYALSYALVIDRGSTTTKAMVFDTRGEEILVSARPSPKLVSPREGWREQDMNLVWQVAAEAIKGVFDAGIAPSDILCAIAVGQGNGMMPIGRDGKPSRMGIHSLDNRAAGILSQWQADGRYAKALETVGLPFSAGSPLPLLCWLHENSIDEYNAIHKVLFTKDWIGYKLSGAVFTDPTDASGAGLMNLRKNSYAYDIFNLLGIAEAHLKLPEIRLSHEIIGTVTKEAAKQTGLLAGTPVLCGAHDIAAYPFGIGAADPRQLVCAMGTWGMNLVPVQRLDGLPAALYHSVPGWYLTGMGDGNSGACLDYMLDLLDIPHYSKAENMIDGREPTDVMFHPFIFGAGANFHGIRSWHGKADLLLAVYEGIAMGHCFNISMIPGHENFSCMWLAGGGSKSKIFGQLFADITGLPVEIPMCTEITARGGALNALVGLGICRNHEEAAIPVQVKTEHRPDPGRHAFYASKFKRFKEKMI